MKDRLPSEYLPVPSSNPGKDKVWIEFHKPSHLSEYIPPEGLVLVGDCHLVRGAVAVIGGPPGVGKSRAAVALAQAGALGVDWFGLKIHRKFKTMLIQTENGRFRLKREFEDLNCQELDSHVLVSAPPPYGLAFEKVEFIEALKAEIDKFQPDVVCLDPWNAAARDDKQKDYRDTFDVIRSILPAGDQSPAILIVAHTRKPKGDERVTGRALLNLLAGSHLLGSIPRCVWVMQAGSDDTEDSRIVWTCCKNNDGELGPRSAWERKNGLFSPASGFDWEGFDNPSPEARRVSEEDLSEIFENGRRQLLRSEAVKRLEEGTGLGRSACYNALKLDGRFADFLFEKAGLLGWKGDTRVIL